MDENTALAMLLRARGLLYATLSRCFGDAPDETLIRLLSSSEFDQICAVLDDDGETLSTMQDTLGREAAELGAAECQRQYTACFIGLETLVSPWESVYVTGENLIFQPCTLSVREAYRSAGFETKSAGREPDDHIAVELDFMAKLAELAADEFENGDVEATLSALVASRLFLAEHLGCWIGDFSDALELTGEKGAFYWRIARFAVGFVNNDDPLLEELVAAVAERKSIARQ